MSKEPKQNAEPEIKNTEPDTGGSPKEPEIKDTEPEQNTEPETRAGRKTGGPPAGRKWLIILAAAVAAAVCVVVLVILPMTAAREPVASPVLTAVASAPSPAPTPTPGPSPSPPPTPTPEPEILPELKELYGQNSDLAGWLKIGDTVIDYPVMFTPDDGEFYLYRTFEKEDDPTLEGTLFIDKNCSVDPRGANLIIHGHNMRNGSMFHTLTEYMDEEYYLEHPAIEYSSLYETGEYEIAAVFLSKIYRKSDDVFKFYQFYDAKTKAEFDDFVQNIRELALYETGITPEFGDELITLTTCEYSQDNGRIVVVGRRVTDSE